MAKKPKQPKVAQAPIVRKTAKFETDPTIKGGPISWRFSHADKAGPFAWTCFEEAAIMGDVLTHLTNVEGLSEKDLINGGSHAIEVYKLSKPARDRLEELQHDDLDSLFSLRMTGKRRIFCIHHGTIMRVLWYDPEHQVCPATLKHT
ncbi:hypothetical protein GOL41_26310 [Sinorhizobium medicae]|uniref:hypothetical protein n=1 Tax=Sinorhizobium medicae TaxID=110321 RepID=UPI0011A9A23F|nr:hypothetical protein [Sinorhizobium medicae]MDX0512717.1 hypothetical protein [Sinorhizobium medicae]MDX0870590.1 hypothetical protein [Sinorhizobium medicae]MDX0925654.1 hypothetical protein [Sinorhizobium medicae]MDX0937785.1 hypothetical protein [Sinorhizobium medicae]MDX0943424.1 hypothetical protein [Sinorhizobium medicae]